MTENIPLSLGLASNLQVERLDLRSFNFVNIMKQAIRKGMDVVQKIMTLTRSQNFKQSGLKHYFQTQMTNIQSKGTQQNDGFNMMDQVPKSPKIQSHRQIHHISGTVETSEDSQNTDLLQESLIRDSSHFACKTRTVIKVYPGPRGFVNVQELLRLMKEEKEKKKQQEKLKISRKQLVTYDTKEYLSDSTFKSKSLEELFNPNYDSKKQKHQTEEFEKEQKNLYESTQEEQQDQHNLDSKSVSNCSQQSNYPKKYLSNFIEDKLVQNNLKNPLSKNNANEKKSNQQEKKGLSKTQEKVNLSIDKKNEQIKRFTQDQEKKICETGQISGHKPKYNPFLAFTKPENPKNSSQKHNIIDHQKLIENRKKQLFMTTSFSSNSNITFGQISPNDSKNDITFVMNDKTAPNNQFGISSSLKPYSLLFDGKNQKGNQAIHQYNFGNTTGIQTNKLPSFHNFQSNSNLSGNFLGQSFSGNSQKPLARQPDSKVPSFMQDVKNNELNKSFTNTSQMNYKSFFPDLVSNQNNGSFLFGKNNETNGKGNTRVNDRRRNKKEERIRG